MKSSSNHDILSRREFFRKAAKGAMTFLALGMVSPGLLSACSKDDDEEWENAETGEKENASGAQTSAGEGTETPTPNGETSNSGNEIVINPYDSNPPTTSCANNCSGSCFNACTGGCQYACSNMCTGCKGGCSSCRGTCSGTCVSAARAANR